MSSEDDIGENKFWIIIWGMIIAGFLVFCSLVTQCVHKNKQLDLECQKMGGKIGKYVNEPDCILPEKK